MATAVKPNLTESLIITFVGCFYLLFSISNYLLIFCISPRQSKEVYPTTEVIEEGEGCPQPAINNRPSSTTHFGWNRLVTPTVPYSPYAIITPDGP